MRVHICAVGRLRAGPERALIEDYLTRFERSGRGLGLTLGGVHEVEDKKGGGKPAEATLLSKVIPDGATLIALDEHGKVFSSPKFASHLSTIRDAGCGDLAFVIGGADGIAPELLAKADMKLSFGAMVWPHMLARVMLSEQLYRAASILAGSPYHRV
ncbi:23S rRNA (pseudouridine(1915)-N(3))-methyltransferase RlmH [Roseovarius sp. 2305UL8-3]|uniref:23S rRNA (pseudouridine(1915)-N(3))-methyltransferase RlmH n=1 Tax=Roseovarius conchicola TaxID=3121636 RepID=UPI003529192C